jgi:hypothetical protein
MACACKVNQQLSKLREQYGIKENRKKIKINFRLLMTRLCVLIISPFILIYILSILLFSKDKMIDVRKIFLKKHGK